ncbi:MAG: SURF1 family protein [Sneathiella sp.]
MKKFSPGLWPTVMTVPVVGIMLALCIWQLDRYSWKVDLVDRLTEQLAAAPTELPVGPFDLDEWGYRRVILTGTFQHDKEIHLFAHAVKGRKGFQIITPFIRSDNKGAVLVNRGWVPEEKKTAGSRKEGLAQGIVTISGVIRKPWEKAYSFLPASDAAANVWLYGELSEMAEHVGLDVSPTFVELDDAPVAGGWPLGGQTRVSVPNNHIEYFITWLGLAGAMAFIYVLFGFSRATKQEK